MSRVGAAFVEPAAAFLASHALITASPDHASPSNGGVLLVKPRRWVYDAAQRLMRGTTWSEKGGFNRVGAPHALWAQGDATLALLRQLQAGADAEFEIELPASENTRTNRVACRPSAAQQAAGKAPCCCVYFCDCNVHSHVPSALNMTDYMRGNKWSFVCGNSDQGMIWYLLYVVHGVGTWARFPISRGDSSTELHVEHFWGHTKPWNAGTADPGYLRRLSIPNPPRTRCERQLLSLRERAAPAKRRGGAQSVRMRPFPAPTVVDFKVRKEHFVLNERRHWP